MSYQIQSTTLKDRVTHHHILTCQVCCNPENDIYVCKICLTFSCHPCTKDRICPNHNIDQQNCRFQRIYHQNGVIMELAKKNSEANRKRFYDFPSKYLEQNGNCQRCLIISATKQCLKCKISKYCEQCFKMVHSTPKLQNHQMVVIKQNVQKTRNLQSKQFNLNLKTNMQSVSNKQIQNVKEQAIQAMQNNIKFMKKSLEQEYKNYQNQISKCIGMVTNQFQNLIEETKLKLVEITLKIKENQRDHYERYQQKNKSILSQQKILNNLKTITNNISQLQAHIINRKIDSCYEEVTKLIRANELSLNLSKEPIQKRCQQVVEEIQQILYNVTKVQIKKNWVIIDPLKTSMSISTPRGDKNIKNLKSSLFINSARSQKPNPLTMSLMTPKKLQGSNMKIQTEVDKFVAKLSFTEQEKVINCPQDGSTKQKQFDLDKCLKFGANKKKVKQPSILIDTKMSLASPKGSMKIVSGKNIENATKFKIVKGLNLQKTKKTIKQIQNQLFLSQCSSNLVEEQTNQIKSGRKQLQLMAPKTSRV